jgi:hypothetical protein
LGFLGARVGCEQVVSPAWRLSVQPGHPHYKASRRDVIGDVYSASELSEEVSVVLRSRTLFFLLFSATACLRPSDPPGDQVTTPVLPIEVAGWTAAGESEHYDTESIFAYIDGHAEIYLAYGMKGCISQRYADPEGGAEIVVDLFEMASPSDAFGVYSHDRAGEVVELGRGGVFRHGWLSFWKGAWYASVYSTSGDEGSRDSVLEVGRAVADALADGGDVPALVGRLPDEGLDPATVCFLRSPQILNAHVFVGGDNIFGLGGEAEAAVGKYDLGETDGHLVLVRYPDEAAAETVDRRFRDEVGDDGTRPVMVVGRRGAYVAAVVGVESDEVVEALLEAALGGEE